MTNKLRDELACIVRVELNQQALDTIDGCEAVRPYEYEIADRIIDHLAPNMREVVGVLDNLLQYIIIRPSDTLLQNAVRGVDKALASLSEWQEKGE
jgi:hypothetical protein